MALKQAVLDAPVRTTHELNFAGDGVLLAGQVDYPQTPAPVGGFPLVFILHHAGCNARDSYSAYADIALSAGYAVFRWDKRGTGRSGAAGRGSTTQDAVNAFEVALEQDNVNPRRVVIVAQGAGSGMLGDSFGLFARQQQPYGVILVSNMLNEEAIVAIESRLLIVMSQDDFNPWQEFGEAACIAHNRVYKNGASYYVARAADRTLTDLRTEDGEFHDGARKVIGEWLRTAHPGARLI
jgi:hypothetical protein